MTAQFDIDLKKLKNGNILYYENGKIISVSKDDFFKQELREIEEIKTENTNFKRVIEKKKKKIAELAEKFKKNALHIWCITKKALPLPPLFR